MAARFESLREYALLPRGRKNRVTPLTSAQIVAVIAGLVTFRPNWAGHASIILTGLRPVGGQGASFAAADTLSKAIEILLSDTAARESFLYLSLSVAETGGNTNGSALLVYEQEGVKRRVGFVPKMAVSQLRPGAETLFDFDSFHARNSRTLTLSRSFFDSLSSAIAHAAAFPSSPAGDGSEYDAEEARQARLRALGVRGGSRFLNVGIDARVTWPRDEVLVSFDSYYLVLMPRTKENSQSIHIDLYANQLDDVEALTVINRFLSVLTWCGDEFAVARGGWSGNPVPVAVSRRNTAFATAHNWSFNRKIPATDGARKALGLFREGLNAEEAGLSSYAVLSYFKIIESRYNDGERAKQWIGRTFPLVVALRRNDGQLKHFLAACAGETPQEYLYKACRHAVAHASVKHPTDADDFLEVRRLYSASHVLRLLARHFISTELGLSDSIISGD